MLPSLATSRSTAELVLVHIARLKSEDMASRWEQEL
jgi:hypothetical protein